MQGALRARLIAAAPVTALVGTRVYWLTRPQGHLLPAITLQTVSGDLPQTMAGFQDTRTARVQMDCWALSYSASRQVYVAAVAALAPKETSNGIQFGRMYFEGEQDFIERLETQDIYRTSVDLIVWHTPV